MGAFPWSLQERMNGKPYLTVHEVAQRFGVNPTTVYHLARQGELPAFKVGNQWRFSKAMLESWIAEQVTGTAQHLPSPTNR
jgi:excisionase family DNA binding protein